MKIYFTIQDQRSGTTAIVDECFNIHSADEVLKKKILFEVDFAKTHKDYIKPILLVFYEETKRNPTLKIKASQGAIRALKRKPRKNEIN